MVEKALIGYYAACLVYYAIRLKWKPENLWFTAVILAVLPFLGLVFSLIQLAASRGGDSDAQRFQDLLDRYEEKDARVFQRIDVSKEANLVPLEDALAINDLATRRRLLLDVLKEDADESMIPLLEQAVNNEDTETSHYAVTAVMEIKRKLLLAIQKWSVKYSDNHDDLNVVLSYANALKHYMASGFMNQRMQYTYRATFVQLLDRLLDSESKSPALFMEKINAELELGRYDEAERCIRRFREAFPNNEDAYLVALNLYYRLKMRESFFETLKQLKQSSIRVSPSTLNIIRYWSAKGA